MNNPICLNSNSYHGFTLEEAVEGAKRAGIHLIELAGVIGWTEHVRNDYSDEQIAKVLNLLQDNEIKAIGMCGHTNIQTKEGQETFKKNLHLAKKLGVEYVTLSTGETHGDESVIKDDSELVEIIQELAKVAKDLDLVMAIETHGNNYATGQSIIELLKKVNLPNVRLNYDTGNVIFYGAIMPYEDLDSSTGSITGIHLKEKAGAQNEWNFPAIGRGDIDFSRIFEILKKNKCTAALSIEIEFTPKGPSGVNEVHESLAYSVETINRLSA
jgi:L-ribulose-5-phosphate 3-epimerase